MLEASFASNGRIVLHDPKQWLTIACQLASLLAQASQTMMHGLLKGPLQLARSIFELGMYCNHPCFILNKTRLVSLQLEII